MVMGNQESHKRMVILQLKAVQKRANQGIHTHEDYRILVNTMIKLTNLVFEPLIQEERSDKS